MHASIIIISLSFFYVPSLWFMYDLSQYCDFLLFSIIYQNNPEGTQDCVGVNLWLMTEFDFTSLFKSNLSLFPLSPAVIHYSTDNKETCERYQQQCSQNARCTDYSTGFCCHCNSGFYGNGRHCLPNGKTAVKRAVVKATHNMTLFWKYDQHSQYISGDILSVFLFPTHYFKSKHVYFCNAKELVDNILIWYANSKQLFPVKLGLLLTVPLRASGCNCL